MYFLQGIFMIMALSTLPLLFWERAKTDEFYGIAFVGVILGEGYALYVDEYVKDYGYLELLLMSLLYSLLASFVVLMVFLIINTAISQGENQFNRYKAEYLLLKMEDDPNEKQKDRMEYLKSQGYDKEFKPKRFK